MKRFAGTIILLIAILISSWVMFGVYIPEGHKGVRYNRFGSGRGLQDYVLGSGLTWRIPFYSQVQVLKTGANSFRLENSRPRGANPHRNALYINTEDRIGPVNTTVYFALHPDFVLEYAKLYFGIPPKIVVESHLRIEANRSHESIDDIIPPVQDKLKSIGVRMIRISPGPNVNRNTSNARKSSQEDDKAASDKPGSGKQAQSDRKNRKTEQKKPDSKPDNKPNQKPDRKKQSSQSIDKPGALNESQRAENHRKKERNLNSEIEKKEHGSQEN